jgi:hypothetical protein
VQAGLDKSSENPCTEEEAPTMYKRHNGQLSLYESPEMFGGLPLNPENDWVKLGQMLPWDMIEDRYLQEQSEEKTGQPATSARMTVGALIIKSWYNISDERVTQEIAMNPYLQYFLGLTEYRYECPFHPSEMSRFRKRVSPELMIWVNDLVTGRPEESSAIESESDDGEDHIAVRKTMKRTRVL